MPRLDNLSDEQLLDLDATVGQLFEEVQYRLREMQSYGIDPKQALPMFLRLTDTSDKGTPSNDDAQKALFRFQSEYTQNAVGGDEVIKEFSKHYRGIEQAVLALRAIDQSLRTYNESPGRANSSATYRHGDSINILTTTVTRTEFLAGNRPYYVQVPSTALSNTSAPMQRNIGIQLVFALEGLDPNQKNANNRNFEDRTDQVYRSFPERRAAVLAYLDQKRVNIRKAGIPAGVPPEHSQKTAKERRNTITKILALEEHTADFGVSRALPNEALELLLEIKAMDSESQKNRTVLLQKGKKLVEILKNIDNKFEPGDAYRLYIVNERPNSNITLEPFKAVTDAYLVEVIGTVARDYQRAPAVAEALSQAVLSSEPTKNETYFQYAASKLAALASGSEEADFKLFVNSTSHLKQELTPVMQALISTYLDARTSESTLANVFLVDEFLSKLESNKIDPNIVFTQPNFFQLLSDAQFTRLTNILLDKINIISAENFKNMLMLGSLDVKAPRRNQIPLEMLHRLSSGEGASDKKMPDLTDDQHAVFGTYLNGLNRVINFHKASETQKAEVSVLTEREGILNTTTTNYRVAFIGSGNEAGIFMQVAQSAAGKENFDKTKFFEAFARIKTDELEWREENDPEIVAEDREKQIKSLDIYINNARSMDDVTDQRFIDALIKLNDSEQKQHAKTRFLELGGSGEEFDRKIGVEDVQEIPAKEIQEMLDKQSIAEFSEKQVQVAYDYICENEAQLRGQPRNEAAVNRGVFSAPGNSRFAEILEQLKDRLFYLALHSKTSDETDGLKNLAQNAKSMQILATHASGGLHMSSPDSAKILAPLKNHDIPHDSPAMKTALSYAKPRAERSETAMPEVAEQQGSAASPRPQ